MSPSTALDVLGVLFRVGLENEMEFFEGERVKKGHFGMTASA